MGKKKKKLRKAKFKAVTSNKLGKSRFRNPYDGSFRAHSQVHKSKKKYDRKRDNKIELE